MNIRSRLLCTALVLLAALAAGSCRQQPGAARANVLLVVIDTLRADHLGSYGYARPTSPRLDELARQGVRFANARASSSWTLPSVATIMTGLYPAIHGAEQSDSVLSDDLDTMAEDYRTAGYETAAFSANPAFVTPRQGLARGFERFDVLHGAAAEAQTAGAVPSDASLKDWVREATAEDVTSAALGWLVTREAAKPFFLYVHYFDPHAAYTPPPEFAQQMGVDPQARLAGQAQWAFLLAPDAPPVSVLSTLVKLYDAEIAATDAAVGRLLDALPASVRQSTIVVVTADHGEEFGEHGGVQHGRTLYDELILVPLLIAGPGLPAGKVVQPPVSLAGLRATLASLTRTSADDAAAMEPSFESLIQHDSADSTPVFADLEKRFKADRQVHRRAIVDGSWKLLLDPERGSQLFDLSTDRDERQPVSEQEHRRNVLRAQVVDRDAAAVARRASAPPRRILLDPAKREQLKALGYLQ